jgi:hypothetical protein
MLLSLFLGDSIRLESGENGVNLMVLDGKPIKVLEYIYIYVYS